MERVIYIGTIVDAPDNSYLIDIPAVHLRNHLFDSLKDYSESCTNPTVYIPDTRILTPDSIRQFVSFLRIHPFVNVVACARQEEDVPYLFKFMLKPVFHKQTAKRTPLYEIALELTNDTHYVELVAELTDLGFFTNSKKMYSRILN